ncbi:DUF1697 domain-containing protein [Aquimarina muelleri]|uniref:DUF1697 domain-containing protein n=1 Tax=Aquimarina muelleri TaxID=279356 RepID=UPI003F688334
MKTYIALLRGINVSGQKKIKMADLKSMLENLGFTSVTTYIQSGNVIFMNEEKNTKDLSAIIEKEILKKFSFDVPVLVLTREGLMDIYENNPYLDRIKTEEIEDKKMYFTLLSTLPNFNGVQELLSNSYKPEEFEITDNTVYFFAANGYGKTKLNNNFFEKKLKSVATTRNLKTIVKLLELSL